MFHNSNILREERNEHSDVLKWTSPVNSFTWWGAIEKGHLNVLKWALESGHGHSMTSICAAAAEHGQLEVLKWARSQGFPWCVYTCMGAAENGHLEVLKWARANGCPWDEYTWIHAYENGHLEVARWALANGCPWYNYASIYTTELPKLLPETKRYI
jgi:hypothetical protein